MIGVIQFPGSNCDLDVLKILKKEVRTEVRPVWFKEDDLSDLDGIVIPGGLSYGDHLRAGAIAARMGVLDQVKKIAEAKKPVLGICNGFQVLTESGLLKGALSNNISMKFICKWVKLRVENNETAFTSLYKKGEIIDMPIAHGEGRFLCDEDTLKSLKDNNQIVFRYVDENGEATEAANPNGSLDNIAGTCNESGTVLGLMPHPERVSEKILGSTSGLKMFKGMVNFIEND
jgi:phosphoribosylformylglycinamidine synthase